MEAWEQDARAAYKKIEAGSVDAEAAAAAVRGAAAAVFAAFCSRQPSPDRFGPGRLQFGAHGPIYGRDREEVVETVVRGDSAKIRTVRKGPPLLTLIYELVRSGPEWRIKDNRRRVKPDGKTTPWDL